MMTSKDVMTTCKYNYWIAMHVVWKLLNQNEWRFIYRYLQKYLELVYSCYTTKIVICQFDE